MVGVKEKESSLYCVKSELLGALHAPRRVGRAFMDDNFAHGQLARVGQSRFMEI